MQAVAESQLEATGAVMEIALYDLEMTPWLERLPNGVARLHTHVGVDIEGLASELSGLSEGEHSQLLELWSNPAATRNYLRTADFVLITG
jgi:hypothetical protein